MVRIYHEDYAGVISRQLPRVRAIKKKDSSTEETQKRIHAVVAENGFLK